MLRTLHALFQAYLCVSISGFNAPLRVLLLKQGINSTTTRTLPHILTPAFARPRWDVISLLSFAIYSGMQYEIVLQLNKPCEMIRDRGAGA